MIGFDEALSLMLTGLDEAGSPAVERVSVHEALDRIVAEPVIARWSLPSIRTSVMDGYAIRCADLEHSDKLPLIGESAAGHPLAESLPQGRTAQVSTGAGVPDGADCVVPREDVVVESESGTTVVRFNAEARRLAIPGRYIRPIGSDVREGEVLVDRGVALRPGDVALVASAGWGEVPVFRKPRVGILCTGDELIAPGEKPEPGQIIGTNGMMLAMQIREAGGVPIELAIAGDTIEAHDAALDGAAECDLLLTSGGISVGDHDLVYGRLLARGFEASFRKVRLRPGKPTTFGLLARSKQAPLPVLALPGNPASTYVTFEVFGRPAVRKLGGHASGRWHRIRRTVTLDEPTRGNETRTHFVRAVVTDGRARALSNQNSGALRSISGHNALLIVPEGHVEVSPGDSLDALCLWDEV